MKINFSHTAFRANKMSKTQAKALDDSFKKSNQIDILCHESSDRDTANSALAMWQYLKSQGINSRIILSQNLELLKLRDTDCEIVQATDKNEVEKFTPDGVLCVDFSNKDRVDPYLIARFREAGSKTGIDHHKDINIVDNNYTYISKPFDNLNGIETSSSFYVDSSAKSATSIIYRFFEALDYEIENPMAYDLFYGLIDDCTKKGLIKCDGQKGTIEPSGEFREDKNAFEIYENLKKRLSDSQVAQIANNIDIMSSLNKKEEAFLDSLKENVKFSSNNKIAYIEIPPDDPQWQELGGDNSITSTILNRYRQKLLKDYPQAQAAFCFYEAHGNYRLSAHSKKENLLDFFNYIDKTKIPDFSQNAGGHQSRGGGKIYTTDKESCHNWVSDIISCADFYDKN